jgi:hypothetical protein
MSKSLYLQSMQFWNIDEGNIEFCNTPFGCIIFWFVFNCNGMLII